MTFRCWMKSPPTTNPDFHLWVALYQDKLLQEGCILKNNSEAKENVKHTKYTGEEFNGLWLS